MMKPRAIPIVTLSGLAALASYACSSSRDAIDVEAPPFVQTDGGPTDCGFKCSRDLKKVLKGCEGLEEVVATCGPDQGCGVDSCVDACASAAEQKGSTGCAFWTLPPDDAQYGVGSCYAAMVANTWDRAANLTAEYDGKPLDISQSVYTVTRDGASDPVYTQVTGGLEPGQVGIVFLAQTKGPLADQSPPCPPGTIPAIDTHPIKFGTTKTTAIGVFSDTPVAAYSIFPYGGADSWYPSATLLLPVSAWDKSYLAVSTAKFGDIESSSLDRRTLQIVATDNDTQISMRPNVNIVSGKDVDPGIAGEVVTWTLQRGQVLQITQNAATTGSPVSSNKPVGMFGGSPCAFLPAGEEYCDLTQQQIAPFAQWGTEYALVPYLSRVEGIDRVIPENVPWSMIGAADGTTLTYDPIKPPGAPETLAAGQVVTFSTDTFVTVKSQDRKHPFHAAVYMTGSTTGGGSPGGGRTLGDPDFVNIVPTAQYLDRYVFFSDYTYPETNLTLVRKKSYDGFRPVELDCAGPIDGWKPLGASGEYEYTFVKLTTGFVAQTFPKGTCGHGRHEIQSTGAFGITVWGWGKDASYGYAGGMGARPVNDAPPPSVQ